MKTLLFAITIIMGFGTAAIASVPQQVKECKYDVKDASIGLANFVIIDFIPKQVSEDGNMKMGYLLYHNPQNSNESSVNAMKLVIVNKKAPGSELVLVVIYTNDDKNIIFERAMSKDGKSVTSCFTKRFGPANVKIN